MNQKSFSYWICHQLNKQFPRPRYPGRENHFAYAEYEYSMASITLEELSPIMLKQKTVLDIGCGTGGKTVYYAEQGTSKIIGVDINSTLLVTARVFADKHSIPADKIEFVCSDAATLPFEDNTFDVIMGNDSFEHIFNLQDTVEECFRVLKPGGLLGITLLPYRSKSGAHLYDYIAIPWCQYVLPEHWLVEYWKAHYSDDFESGAFTAFINTPNDLRNVKTIKDLVHVNKLSLRQIIRLLENTGFELVREDRIISRKLKLLSKVPYLDEFVTYGYKGVFKKV